jgi:rhodanese-related sulfurtransferase
MIDQLSPSHFSAWRDTALPDSPIVLDVREPWEVQTASVTPDGFTLLHIPMQSIPARLAELKETHGADHPIACLCHHGMRSMQVANYLAQSGFTAVVNLQGGIAAWAQQLDSSVPQY